MRGLRDFGASIVASVIGPKVVCPLAFSKAQKKTAETIEPGYGNMLACSAFDWGGAGLSVGEKRQVYHHKPGLSHRSCSREFPITEKQIAMIRPSLGVLANARKPGFNAFIFTHADAKTPTGNSADYKLQAGSG